MEEVWDDTGPYVQAKLADRVVPVPRDTEPPVGLYALCRAWVRNNPKLPLTADTSPRLQRDSADAAARLGGPSAVTGGQQQEILALQQGRQQEPEAGGEQGQQLVQQQQQRQPQDQEQQARRQREQREPLLQPQQKQQQQDAPSSSLISILPPLLPPTVLETDTSPPTYPLDDFEAQEPDEAMRKLKEHWVGVRQYHQAIYRAKRARHRERLQVLLGEPSSFQPPPGVPVVPHQQQQQSLALPGMMAAPLPEPLLPNGGPCLGFQPPLMLPGLAAGTTTAPGIGLGEPGLAAGGAAGISADAHAALALLSSLSQGLPTSVGLLSPQPPPLTQQEPQQQPVGNTENVSTTRPQEPMRLQGSAPELLAGGQPVGAMMGMPTQPVLGQLSAAVAAAAAVSQCGLGAIGETGIEVAGAGARAGVPETNALSVVVEGAGGQGAGRDCVDSMDVDVVLPNNG